MQIHQLKSSKQFPAKRRVARGGKRGTYSGRGVKGQKSRSGHRIRPAERDLMMRLPKLRGYKNRPITEKLPVINVGDLEKKVKGAVVNAITLGNMKILGEGTIQKAFTIEGLAVSKSAKVKIEAAGGTIVPAIPREKKAPAKK